MVLEVTPSHEEHIISLLSSKKNDLRNERSQLAGINCWFWNWLAVCPRTLQNSWTNSAAHCCWPFWKWLLICGKQDTSVAGRTTPGVVSYSFRKFRVLHTRHVSPKIIWDYTVVFYIWTICGGISSICPRRGCASNFFKSGALPLFCRILVILESHRSSWRRGGCTLPLYLDLRMIKNYTVSPHTKNTNIDINNDVEPSCYKIFEFLSHSLKLNECRGHGHSVCGCVFFGGGGVP